VELCTLQARGMTGCSTEEGTDLVGGHLYMSSLHSEILRSPHWDTAPHTPRAGCARRDAQGHARVHAESTRGKGTAREIKWSASLLLRAPRSFVRPPPGALSVKILGA